MIEIPIESLRKISEADYQKLPPDEQRISDAQTLMARKHAIFSVIKEFIESQKPKRVTAILSSSTPTEADFAARRRFVEETGDYRT